MLLACISNGLGVFGLKILAERKLTERYEFPYLLVWYGGWFLFGLAVWFYRRFRPNSSEVAIAVGMGFCSVAGQLFTGLALSRHIAGHIAFSVSTGGTLFVVALAGIFLFRERVGPYGLAGLILGILSIVVLTIA